MGQVCFHIHSLGIEWRGQGAKAKVLKEKYGAKLEFPDLQKGGGANQKPFCGSGAMDIFWNYSVCFKCTM